MTHKHFVILDGSPRIRSKLQKNLLDRLFRLVSSAIDAGSKAMHFENAKIVDDVLYLKFSSKPGYLSIDYYERTLKICGDDLSVTQTYFALPHDNLDGICKELESRLARSQADKIALKMLEK